MAFVRIVPASQATGLLKEQYENIAKHTGASEPNHLVECWSLQPEAAAAWSDSLRAARANAGLDTVLYELMECRIMYLLKCRYVLVNHCYLLARASDWAHERIRRSVQRPHEQADLDDRQKAVLRLADKACLRSHETTVADIEGLRAVGFDDAQVVALVFTISALISNAVFPNLLGPELNEFSREFRDIADWV